MSDETLTIAPKNYGKVGLVHCDVCREGFVSVGGEVRDIADGEEILFDRTGIKAKRNGSEYTFTGAAQL